MIQHGLPPYLECSTRGDQRFSAFCARIKARNNRTIEAIYQASKIFFGENGGTITGLSWKEAKGVKAINQEECNALYSQLWDEYIAENPHLIPLLTQATGLCDRFGQPGRCCQATELWRIRREHLK